jgi:hypothetical protein
LVDAFEKNENMDGIYSIAPFCRYYENLGDDLKVKELRRKFHEEGGRDVYQYTSSDLKIGYEDLVRLRYEGFEYRLDDNAKAFQRKLMYWVSYLNITAKSKYYESLEIRNTDESEEKLDSCLDKNVSSHVLGLNRLTREQSKNPIMYRALLFDYFNGAIGVAAMLEKLEQIKKEFDKKERELSQKLAVYRVNQISLIGPRKISEADQKEHRDLEDALKIVQTLREQALIAYKMPYYTLAQNFPLLFKYENSFKPLNWMNKELSLTDFYHQLIKDVDPVLWETMKSVVSKTGDFNDLADIYMNPVMKPEMDRIFNAKMKDASLKFAAETAASAYINEMNDHSLALCEQSEDHKLHYNSQLVHSVFKQNTKSIVGKPLSLHKSLTIRDQAGYCHLLKQDPPMGEAILRTPEKLGFAAFGTGMLHKFITGKTRFAWSLYTLGSGAFLYNAGEEWNINMQLRNSTFPMLSQGFASEEDYHKLLNKRGDIVTQAVWEVLFSNSMVYALRIVDYHYMRYLVKNYDVKKHEFTLPHSFWSEVTRGKVKQALLMGNSDLHPAGFFKKLPKSIKHIQRVASKAKQDANGSSLNYARNFYNYLREANSLSKYDPKSRDMYLSIMQEKHRLFSHMANKYNLTNKLRRIRERLGYFTHNHDWPAYLNWRRKDSHIDLVVVALEKGAHKTEEGLKKLEELKELLRKVPKTSEILRKRIDMAFNSKLLLPKVEKVKNRIRTGDFTDMVLNPAYNAKITGIAGRHSNEAGHAVKAAPDVPKWVPVSRSLGLDYAWIENGKLIVEYDIMKNGRIIKSKKVFASKSEFLNKYSEIRKLRHSAVSNSISQETYKWSGLMDDLFSSALDHEVFNIAKKRLEVMKENLGLSTHQQEVLDLLQHVTKQEARIDITAKVLFREIGWEFVYAAAHIIPRPRDLLKMFSKGDPKKLDDSLEQFEKVSPWFTAAKSAVALSALGFVTDIYQGLNDYGSSWHQRREWVGMYWREFWRWFYGGKTNEEKQCAIELRPLSFHLCYHRLAFQEAGYEWSKGIKDGRVYARDEHLKRKMRDYAYRMVRLRKHYRASEVYEINKDSLKQNFHNTAIEELVERVIDQMIKSDGRERNIDRDVIGGLVYAAFHAKTDRELLEVVAKLKKLYDKNIVEALLKAISMEDKFFKRSEEGGAIPVEILNILERYQYDPAMDENSLLKLFQGEVIRAYEMQEFDQAVEKEVLDMIDNNTYAPILKSVDGGVDEGIKLTPEEEKHIQERRAEAKRQEEERRRRLLEEEIVNEDEQLDQQL